MFGRRPQPDVFAMFTIGPAKWGVAHDGKKKLICKTGILITNDGPGIARDLFLNVEVYSIPGENCVAWFDLKDRNNWAVYWALDFKLGAICNEGFRIAPRNFAEPIMLNTGFAPPFNKHFKANIMCGCEGAPVYTQELNVSPTDVERIYNEIISLPDIKDSHQLSGDLIGLDKRNIKPE